MSVKDYKGYDIRTPKGVLPSKFIAHSTYSQTPDQLMDLDPKRNGKGILVRNVLENSATTIEFTTVPMSMKMKAEFQSYFPSRERITIEYWNEERNKYCTTDFYIPEIKWTRYGKINGEWWYLGTPITITGYGEKRA